MAGDQYPDPNSLDLPESLRALYASGDIDAPTLFGMDPSTFQELAVLGNVAEAAPTIMVGFTLLPGVDVSLPGEQPRDTHLRLQAEKFGD